MAANDIKKTVKTAKREANDIAEDAHSFAEDVMDDITHYANHAGRTVRDFVETASDTITDSSQQVKERIETHPVRSSVIALGVGFLLGALFRR